MAFGFNTGALWHIYFIHGLIKVDVVCDYCQQKAVIIISARSKWVLLNFIPYQKSSLRILSSVQRGIK